MKNTWDDICKSISDFAEQTGRKIEHLSNVAAIRLKISAKKAELEEAYLTLGKAVYEQSLEQDTDAPLSVETHLSAIAILQQDIASLEQKIARSSSTDT